jgi:hypothetical protein
MSYRLVCKSEETHEVNLPSTQIVSGNHLFQAELFRAWASTQDKQHLGSKLIIVLRRSAARSIENTVELEHAIRQRFPSYTTIAMSLTGNPDVLGEQFLNFSRAQAVVSPHGAQLNNIWPMPLGSSLIEIHWVNNPPDYERPHDTFCGLARNIGVNYFFSRVINVTSRLSVYANVSDVLTLLDQALHKAPTLIPVP